MKRSALITLLLAPIWLLPLSDLASGQEARNDGVHQQAIDLYIRGVTALDNGETEQAIVYLEKASSLDPDASGIHYALAEAWQAEGVPGTAAWHARQAFEMDESNRWYGLKLVEIYRQSGLDEELNKLLKKLEKLHPTDPDILQQIAWHYSRNDNPAASNRIYDRILKIRGRSIELHMNKVQNYRAAGEIDNALRELDRLKELDPENTPLMHSVSRFYMELGSSGRAAQLLEELRERNPGNPETLILLAELYIDSAEWAELGETFLRMIEDPLLTAPEKLELAHFLYLQHQSEPDNETLQRQTRLVLDAFSRAEAEYGEAHLLSADFHLQIQNLDAALQSLERANKALPTHTEGWRHRMQLLYSLEEYEEVARIGTEASTHIQDDANIHFFTGASLMMLDRLEESVVKLEEATMAPAQRQFRSIIYGTLGDVLTRLDRWNDATEAYEMALELDSMNHVTMNNYAYYLTLRSERLSLAEELAKKAVSIAPENAAYLDTLGWICYNQERYEEAKRYIEASIETGEASAEVLEHMGDVLEKLGETDRARDWWQQALDADPDRTHLKERVEV
ncbi:MAG: tetratricopeptide repeat protein [Balneolaceae bacterium]